MQVSWIDPEEIAVFLAQLEGPRKAPAEMAWEVHTLPVEPLPAPTAQPIMGEPVFERPTPVPVPAKPALPPEMPLSDGRPGPDKAEIWNIREQLRSLREMAEGSGIIGSSVPAEAPVIQAKAMGPALTPTPSEAQSYADAEEAEFAPLPVSEPESPRVMAPVNVEDPPEPNIVFEDSHSLEAVFESEPISGLEEPSSEAVEAIAPSSSPASYAARAAMEELFGGPIGPQPEAPPVADPSTLPQPIQPPPSTTPLSIEYSGPAPSTVSTAPMFSSNAPSATPAKIITHEEAMGDILEQALQSVTINIPPDAPADEAPVADHSHYAFVPPALGLSDRIGALANWAISRLGTEEVLLVDDYGDVLWGGNQHTALVLAAMMAWHSAQRANAESACSEPERIDKEIGSGRHLTVIPVRTRYGNVSLAAICVTPINDDEARSVRAALRLAVEGE